MATSLRNGKNSADLAFNGTLISLKTFGLRKTFKLILTLGQPKTGSLVFIDKLGNEYFENKDEVSNRDRFVIYSKWNYDASQIPPSCHSWLSHATDEIVDREKGVGEGFQENLTGTAGAFKTYNTVAPKLETWKPVVKERVAV